MPLLEEFERQGNFLFKYRGTIPLAVLALALWVFTTKESVRLITPAYFYLCFAVSVLGLLIRIYTVGHTPKNTSGRNTKGQLADELNTTGIYSMVRHPLYLGNFFMWLGAALLTQHAWFILFFIGFYWIYYERIMFAEEQFLRKKFGSTYTNWADHTPAFIPSLRFVQKPAYSFSLRKVLLREVNGLMNIFIVFAVFDMTLHYLNTATYCFNHYFWLVGIIISLVAYLVLKYLSKQTNLLQTEGRV